MSGKHWHAPMGAVAGAIAAPGYIVGLVALAAFAPRWLGIAIPLAILSGIGGVAGWCLVAWAPVRSEATITAADDAPGMNQDGLTP